IGTVNILGLVTVYLGLRLQATYHGNRLIGTGTVKLKIKISRFLTIKVDKKYTKTLHGSDSGRQKKIPDEAAKSISTSLG
ncbi:MAG TPA: hypothetical protein PKE66_08935, partial [Pyrinomonadaceae bacterium]|nr:hypothetical protein [Pyrinomonadaceae bacterium]